MSERGQATVELIGMIPAVLLVAALLFQLLAVGYAAVLADHAAEIAAIAHVNGEDPRDAARNSIPGWAGHAFKLDRQGERIKVSLYPPSPLRVLSRKLVVYGSAAVHSPQGAK